MADINKLIDIIMSDDKLKNSKAFGDRVFSDEPILRPASQLTTGNAKKQPPGTRREDVPPIIDEMKRLSYRPDVAWKTSEWLFAAQGKAAADFEDDYEGREEVVRDIPCYRDLNTAQLRTYFTWRAKARRGEYQVICLAFMKLYAYELINLIGAKDALDAYEKLKAFCELYGKNRPDIRSELESWMFDHVVYNRLDPALLAEHPDVLLDKALSVLLHYKEHTDSELYTAICTASSYDPSKSAFAEKQGERFETAVAAVYRAYADSCGASRVRSLFEKLIGGEAISRYTMFRGAVLYPRHGIESFDYELDEMRSFRLTGGCWYCKRYLPAGHSSKQLGELVRMIENELRKREGTAALLKADEPNKSLRSVMKKTLDRLEKEQRAAQKQRIEIDLSKLDSIRHAAELTREKLIVDEEELAEIRAAEQEQEQTPEPEPAAEPAETPLDAAEYSFMQALLYGGEAQEAARSAGSAVTLLADSVNEKLFDLFSDTVIEFDGETPLIIEDYLDDLKGMILP